MGGQSPERRFLLALLTGQRPEDPAAASLDTRKLLADAARFGLLENLSRFPPAQCGVMGVPPSAPFLASALVAENRKRNGEFLALIQRVAEVLAKAGAGCVFLKGAAFLLDDPTALDWRMLSDVDVLVRPETVDAAAAAMLEAGFDSAMPQSRYRAEDHHHLPPFICEATGQMVELHTRLVWDAARNPVSTDDVFRSKRQALVGLDIPCPDHRIAHLVAHAQIGDRNFGARQVNPKDMNDLAHLLARHEAGWGSLRGAFEVAGAKREFEALLAAAHVILGPLCPDAGDAAARRWARVAIGNFLAPRRG